MTTTKVETIVKTSPSTKTPPRSVNTLFRGNARRINNTRNATSMKEQLINTYLTFNYELREGIERKIFWKYVILILFSVDKIKNISSRDSAYKEMFEKVKDMRGVSPNSEQEDWSKKLNFIVTNIDSISPSALNGIFNVLNKNMSM